MQLRDGSTTEDARLDRLRHFDQASRAFPIRALLETKRPRSYTWRCAAHLDQGREGACVGFALTHELVARPAEALTLDSPFAFTLYREAQKIDPWPGEAYEGTSVLAGVKVLHKRGWFGSYRWAFGLQDLILGLGYNGPAVIGVNWYQGMYHPNANGMIAVSGALMGGHAILVRAVNVTHRFFVLRNSWGRSWGRDGDCRIRFEDMERLLHEQGEAVFLVGRRSVPKVPA